MIARDFETVVRNDMDTVTSLDARFTEACSFFNIFPIRLRTENCRNVWRSFAVVTKSPWTQLGSEVRFDNGVPEEAPKFHTVRANALVSCTWARSEHLFCLESGLSNFSNTLLVNTLSWSLLIEEKWRLPIILSVACLELQIKQPGSTTLTLLLVLFNRMSLLGHIESWCFMFFCFKSLPQALKQGSPVQVILLRLLKTGCRGQNQNRTRTGTWWRLRRCNTWVCLVSLRTYWVAKINPRVQGFLPAEPRQWNVQDLRLLVVFKILDLWDRSWYLRFWFGCADRPVVTRRLRHRYFFLYVGFSALHRALMQKMFSVSV